MGGAIQKYTKIRTCAKITVWQVKFSQYILRTRILSYSQVACGYILFFTKEVIKKTTNNQ